MDWLNWISTAISSLAREGLRVTSVIVILAALLKVPWVQRLILRYMPRRFRQREHTRNTAILYEIRELRARMEEMAWDAGSRNGKGGGLPSTSQLSGGATALTTTFITPRTGIFRFKRRRTMTPSKINWVTLVPAVMGGLKLILQSFGIDVITDDLIDQVANVAASVAVIIGIIATHKKQPAIEKLEVPIESGE